MTQGQATLHLAELDQYHQKLVPMMLEMLRPRLARAWRTVVAGDADAVMVDVSSRQGRDLLAARVEAGLGARTIALGNDAIGHLACKLHKPLRLHALLDTLAGIEADGDVPPAPATQAPAVGHMPHYRVLAWPELDARSAHPHRLRVLALLDRVPQTAAEVARRLELELDSVQLVIAALLREGVLATTDATPAHARPMAAMPRPLAAGLGLVSMLRQRFGL